MNANAGALLGRADPAAELKHLFEGLGARVEIIPPDVGTLPEQIAKARATGADMIVIAGGDGSIACAAQALTADRDSKTALGVIPCGTMNLLAKDLQIPVGDTAAAIMALMHGSVRSIDVGEVAGHVFTYASMLGTPANLTRHREASRRAGGGPASWLTFARAGLRAWRRNRAMRLTLRCDGRRYKVRSPSVTITVNPLDDRPGRLFGRSCLDGGKLSVYIVHQNTPWRLVHVLLRALIPGVSSRGGITVLHTEQIQIDSRRRALRVLVDGEMRLLAPPLRYRVLPKALSVASPA